MPALIVMEGNHFSEVTENDAGGLIWVVSLLGLIYTILTFLTRGMIKWHMLGFDDFTLVAAQMFAFGQYGLLFASLRSGLGKTTEMLTIESRALVSRTALASQILLLVTLAFAKCSILFLIRRVFTRDMKHFWLICDILVTIVSAWGVAAVVLVSAGCNSSKYFPPSADQTCTGFSTRWKIVVALDVATEIVIILLPIYFLWTLQMTTKLKLRVVLAFAFRLPVIAFSIVFTSLFTRNHREANPGVNVAIPIVWQQALVAYSLISATIPCLKSFVQSFDTAWGMGDGSGSGPYAYSSTRSRSNGSSNHSQPQYHNKKPASQQRHPEIIKMNSLKPRTSDTFLFDDTKGKGRESGQRRPHVGKLRPERLRSKTVIEGGAGTKLPGERERPDSPESTRSSNTGSQDLIIRRDIQFDVRSEYRRTSTAPIWKA